MAVWTAQTGRAGAGTHGRPAQAERQPHAARLGPGRVGYRGRGTETQNRVPAAGVCSGDHVQGGVWGAGGGTGAAGQPALKSRYTVGAGSCRRGQEGSGRRRAAACGARLARPIAGGAALLDDPRPPLGVANDERQVLLRRAEGWGGRRGKIGGSGCHGSRDGAGGGGGLPGVAQAPRHRGPRPTALLRRGSGWLGALAGWRRRGGRPCSERLQPGPRAPHRSQLVPRCFEQKPHLYFLSRELQRIPWPRVGPHGLRGEAGRRHFAAPGLCGMDGMHGSAARGLVLFPGPMLRSRLPLHGP